SILALDVLIFKTKFSSILFDFLIKYKRGLAKTISMIFLLFIVVVFLHIFFKINIFDIQGMVAAPKGIGLDLDTRDSQLDTLVASQKGAGLLDISQKYIGAILTDFYSLIFSISPIILFAILFAAINIVRAKKMERDSITALYIIFFILIFYLGSTVDNVIATVRYQIVIYPLAFILAAIGISELIKIEKIGKYLKLPVAYALLIIILLPSLFFIRPNYFAYSSEILPSNFLVNLKGMGEGSYEATDYLNNLPNAQSIAIWSDKATACDGFVGSCYWNKTRPAKVDYYIVSTDRKSRTLKSISFDLTSAYENEHPDFEVLIGNNPNNFVKVIKSADLKRTNAQ
ncbi:MAG: hypothetical protein Q8M12_04165, partial [bacterium]|nr:hypothetical protein [bacterium]